MGLCWCRSALVRTRPRSRVQASVSTLLFEVGAGGSREPPITSHPTYELRGHSVTQCREYEESDCM